MPVRSIRVLPVSLALLLILTSPPAQSGTSEAPEVVDAEGDTGLPPLDLAAVWFDANDTHLVVHIERAEGADAPPAIVACQDGECVGAGVSLRVVFKVLKPDGSAAPVLEEYAASYVLVRLGPDDPTLAAATGYYDSAGTATLVGAADATADGLSITVAVPRSSEVVAMPEGPAPGVYRVTEPYALSYVMPCAPSEGCLNMGPQHDAMASAFDRAPDAGFGADYVFAAPPPAAPAETTTAAGSTVTSTTTVTSVQTLTRTTTVEHEVTVTSTPFPLHVEAKGAPGIEMAFVVLALGMIVVTRRWLA